MKNVIIIIFVFSCFSCSMDNYDSSDTRKTEAAKSIYDETQLTIHRYLATLDLVQKIDFYLQADGFKRDSIGFYLLAGYDIMEYGNVVEARNSTGYYSIIRNSTNPINTPSVKWKITCMGYPRIAKNGFVINALSKANTWRLDVVDYYSEYTRTVSSASMEVEITSNNLFEVNYIANNYILTTVEDALCEIRESVETTSPFKSQFTVTTPLIFRSNGFVEGVLDISVIRVDKTDQIRADILSNGMLISFEGVRELWYSI